jgi:hypothetical protein
VVFTESLRTQAYLLRLLGERGYAGAVSLLSGDASTPAARSALIDEFRDRTRILLSTEAGAEGLNLQFCNVVVNFDLPWNPQRLEQRIGRCHRYGQTRDVMVLNFLNRKNAADARLFELLEQKLHLFDGVFGASDEILGALDDGMDFERRVLGIYQTCRSPEAIDAAFDALRADLEQRIDQRMSAARALLFERFDGEVRRRLRLAGEKARDAVARRDQTTRALLGGPGAEAIRARTEEPVRYLKLEPAGLPAKLRELSGREGWWFVYRVELSGLKPQERLVHLVLVKDGARFEPLSAESADLFLAIPAREEERRRPEGVAIATAQERALAEQRRALVHEAERASERELDLARERWDRFAEDCISVPAAKVNKARDGWEAARRALSATPPEEAPARRAAALRAEREYRRTLAAWRAEEAARFSERDAELARLGEQAKVKDRRTLIASAYWWI